METVIELPWPPSLNHYYRHVGSKVLISRDGRRYRELVSARLSCMNVKTMTGDVSLRIDAYPPDNRRRDMDNLLKVLFDSLQLGGLVSDDAQIKQIHMTMREPMPGVGGMVVVSATKKRTQKKEGENDLQN